MVSRLGSVHLTNFPHFHLISVIFVYFEINKLVYTLKGHYYFVKCIITLKKVAYHVYEFRFFLSKSIKLIHLNVKGVVVTLLEGLESIYHSSTTEGHQAILRVRPQDARKGLVNRGKNTG